jgi:hypothetical protein
VNRSGKCKGLGGSTGCIMHQVHTSAIYFKDFEEKTEVQSRHNLDNQPLDIT